MLFIVRELDKDNLVVMRIPSNSMSFVLSRLTWGVGIHSLREQYWKFVYFTYGSCVENDPLAKFSPFKSPNLLCFVICLV